MFTTSSVGGPLLGGFVVNHGDWRWLFLANLPLGLIAAWRVSQLPRPHPSPHRDAPYDPAGFAMFAVAACAALLWFSQVGHRFAPASVPSALLAGLALALGAVLWRQQRRHPNPFLPLEILRVPGVGWVCLSVFGFAGTLFALLFLLPIYLQTGHDANAVDAGLQLLPLTAGIVVGSTINGRVSARTRRSGVLPPWGLGAAALALLGLALLPSTTWVIAIAAGVCGIGFGTVMPNAQMSTQMLAGRDRLGSAAALLSLVRSTGASIGTAAFGGLAFILLRPPAAAAVGSTLRLDQLDPARVAHAFDFVFIALAIFAGLAALAAARAPNMDLSERSGNPKSD